MKTTAIKQRRIYKLPASFSAVAFAFFMSGIMAFLMCLVITAANRGITAGYFHAVFEAYCLAMPVAFACVMVVRPLVVMLVKSTVRS